MWLSGGGVEDGAFGIEDGADIVDFAGNSDSRSAVDEPVFIGAKQFVFAGLLHDTVDFLKRLFIGQNPFGNQVPFPFSLPVPAALNAGISPGPDKAHIVPSIFGKEMAAVF